MITYLHLDHIDEDDDEALRPVTFPLYFRMNGNCITVHGLEEPLYLKNTTPEMLVGLQRFLQRKIDALHNSEAAAFLVDNHAALHPQTDMHVFVRIPLAIARVIAV